MFCTACGAPLSAGARCCAQCGTASESPAAARATLDAPDASDAGLFLDGFLETGRPVSVRVPLRGAEVNVVVGRSRADVEIPSDTVSRRHLCLRGLLTDLRVQDLGSSNGTTVNDVPLRPGEWAPIAPGDKLMVGEVVLRLRVQAADAADASVRPRRAASPSAERATPRPDPTADNVPPAGKPFPSLPERVLALAIDAALVVVAFRAALHALTDWRAAGGGFAHAEAWVVVLLTLYWPILECSPLQGTIGKRLVGIRVVAGDGSRLGLGRALARHLARIVMLVGLPPLGYVSTLVSLRRRAWDDLLSGSVLVRRDATPAQVQAPTRPMGVGGWLFALCVHAVALAVMYVPLQALWEEDPGIELRRAVGIYPADDPPVIGRGAKP